MADAKARIFCLRASAGAGKTHRLTQEFLQLLAETPPSRDRLRNIVAITFTNKAAAEMKERVLSQLKRLALGLQDGIMPRQEAANWIEVILGHWGDFHIRTIDSLVYAILRALALEMGIKPQLDVTFREEEVLDRCFDALLSRSTQEEGTKRLFEDLIECFLTIERKAGLRIEGQLKRRFRELLPRAQTETVPREGPTLEELKQAIEETAREVLRRLDPPPPQVEKILESVIDYLERDIAFWRGKGLPGPLPPEVERLFEKLLRLREQYLRERPRARLRPYLRLLEHIEEQIDHLMREEGVLLGGRWVVLLKSSLEGNVEASYALFRFGSFLRYFLIDEFQDTDRLQWEVLRVLVEEALSQGGRLFYVGDPKQAIYGWRGSDWRLMNEVLEEGLPVSPTERRWERLDCNYRSLERIVDFNNRLFRLLTEGDFARRCARGILGEGAEEELVEEFAAILRENFADVEQRCICGPGGEVEVVPFCAPRDELYRQVSQRLVPEVQRAFSRHRKGVAILVRSNEQAEEVATWLQAAGLPVVTENSLRLRKSRLLKGVVALLKFLDYPPDDLALWGALSSGILHGLDGIPEEELEAFLSEGEWTRPLYKAFASRFPDGFQRYLLPLLRRVGFVAPYEMVQGVIQGLRLLERYPQERPLLLRLLEVVFRSEREGAGSLAAFLSFWEQEGMEQRVGLPEGVEAVKVMTIHKAKGLQFPVVFVPFTNWRLSLPTLLRSEEGELLYLTNPLPPDLLALRLRKKMDEVIEAFNLLYVATTRPQEELHLYVTCYPQGKGVNRGMLSAWLKEMLEEGGFLGP